jgi:hypothetical protein
MPVLSQPDPQAPIACNLPPGEFGQRLRALETIVGRDLIGISRSTNGLTLRFAKGDRADLEADLTRWATDEKACCGFLGFAIASEAGVVTMEVAAPAGAEPTLDGIDWIVRAAAATSAVGGSQRDSAKA